MSQRVSTTNQRRQLSAPVIPPLPRRADSLDAQIAQAQRSLKSVMAAAIAGTPARSTSAPMIREVPPADDSTVTKYVYEAPSLWRDSFKLMYDFYRKGELCDIELKCGTKTIKCHKLVLATSSQYFRTMFMSEMMESRTGIVTIKDLDDTAVELLVKFAYTARIELSTDNVQPLLYASSILQLEPVAHACSEFMKSHLDPTNCIGIRNFAESHGRRELIRVTDGYIYDHFTEVSAADEFQTMSAKHLESILSSDSVNVATEVVIYEAVMKWIKYDLVKRKVYLPRFLAQIKLPLLPAAYLMQHVSTEELIRKDLDCRDFLDEANNYQLSLALTTVPSMAMTDRTRPRKSYAGVLFCVGGRGASGDPFRSIECYDMRRDKWFQISDMTTRRRHVGVCSVEGKLFAIGGHDGSEHLSTGEMFDAISGRWRSVSSMATPRRGIAVASLGGPLYAVGGLDDAACFSSVERYDVVSDSWCTVASMNMPRGGVGVAALKGFLYACGGNDGSTSLDTCEKYDPHVNKWTMVANMSKRRAGAGVAVLNGCVYVIGGFDDNSPLSSVERYDPATNEWSAVSPMKSSRGGVGVAALGGRIYAVGGHDGTNYLNSAESYDPVTNSWSAVASVNLCRAGAGLTFCDVSLHQLRQAGHITEV